MMMDPALSSVKAHKTPLEDHKDHRMYRNVDVDDDVDRIQIFPITGGRTTERTSTICSSTNLRYRRERASERRTTWRGRGRDSREGSSDPQGEEEYEEMKDANAVRRLSRPETDLERAVLEIVKKTISKRRDNKGAGTSDHAHPPPSLNGRRLSSENEPPRRASEDEERERENA